MRHGQLALGSVDGVDRVAAVTRRLASERGYWFARGLLDAPRLLALRGQVLEILRADARLRAVLEVLLGGAVRDRQGDVCRICLPGAPEFATPPHQDQTYLKRPDDVWTAWIPLGDCPRRQGSLAVVPRSNRLGLVSKVPRGARWRRFDFAAGDVLFVHSLTLHRSLVNRSAEIRVSVDCRYSREP